MIDNKIRDVVSNLSESRGRDFFGTMVTALAKVIHADHTFVAEINLDDNKATSIAHAQRYELADNFSYSLYNTPCADVCIDGVRIYNGDVQQCYPEDQLLIDMAINSYVGVAIKDSKSHVQGILVALFKDHIIDRDNVEALFMLFRGLISGELERCKNEKQLYLRQTMIDALTEAVVLTDEHSQIIYTNPAFTNITGYSAEDAKGNTPGDLLKSDFHDASFYENMWQQINTTGRWQGEILNRKKSGRTFPENLLINRFTEPSSGETYYLSVFHDASVVEQTENKSNQNDSYDLLTQLPNRQLLIDRITQQIQRSETDHCETIICLNIDNFRDINNSLGHKTADTLLQKVARRLSQIVTNQDTVARIAGDEFVIFLPRISSNQSVEDFVIQLLTALRAPFFIGRETIEITASIGISTAPQNGKDTHTLLRCAEQASNHANREGKNRYRFFAKEMQEDSKKLLFIKTALAQAITNQELMLFYQPIINLDNQRIEKCEALVRWMYEDQFMPPMEFIPIAEKFSMAKSLGQLVLKLACEQAQALQESGLGNITIAVNRSVAEFPDSEDSQSWLETISNHGIDPQTISFEITESILAPDNHTFTDYLGQLKKAGCRISLDDFGTGYSSLSYLRNFPIDYLKIDGSFVADMETSEDAATLVSTIIAMAKALGLKTIAEGVENKEQLRMLKEQGCNYIQGYFFSRPLPAKEFIDYVQSFQLSNYIDL